MCRRAVGAWGCKDGQNHPGRWRKTEGEGEECWETNRGLSERAKISNSQMNRSRIMRLTRVAALMCVSVSASVRSELTSLGAAVLLYLQSIIPNITNGRWWRQKQANANKTDEWRRLGSSRGGVWPVSTVTIPRLKKKCMWRGKREKQRRNEGETTEGDTEAGPLWKQTVEKNNKDPITADKLAKCSG